MSVKKMSVKNNLLREKNLMKKLLILAVIVLSSLSAVKAEDSKKEKKEAYVFTNEIQLKASPVKNQARTGTCWCFATVSFMESELLRMGRGEFDLSEMYFVHNAYIQKAENYYRLHGMANFGEGGQAHDVFDQLKGNGAVPENVYSGLTNGEQKHNHSEMTDILESMLKSVAKGSKVSPRWRDAYASVMDVYLGKVPQNFEYNGKTYTPQSFYNDVLQLKADDYVELTSYQHHPYYTQFRLEIPDNWSGTLYYNLPIDELMAVIDNAFLNGYTMVWDGDVSDHDFSRKGGYAVLPLKSWDEKSQDEKDAKITSPEPEKTVTQEIRQASFDSFTSTDDHLMHLTGTAKDQNGNKYYITKNSWGTDGKYNGYWYMSVPYVRMNTVAIMVHKSALPETIAQKLGIK